MLVHVYVSGFYLFSDLGLTGLRLFRCVANPENLH